MQKLFYSLILFIGCVLVSISCKKNDTVPDCITGIGLGSVDNCRILIQVDKYKIGKPFTFQGVFYDNVVQTYTSLKSATPNQKIYFQYRQYVQNDTIPLCITRNLPADVPLVKVLNYSTVSCP
jgi:hypothetical protein